ncbi:MAG: signal recognition particle-docking protein FtsY, partial [SAR324 cluster bacterium]
LELQIKEEEKLREEKESAKLAKAEQREKELQEKIASIEEERLNQQVLQREIEKTTETVETPDEVDSFLERLRKGVVKTRTQFKDNLAEAVLGRKEINEDLLDDLEEVLIGSDIGPETTQRILDAITEKVEREELSSPQVLQSEIQLEIQKIMSKTYAVPGTAERKPLILLFVGVNGVGKTTTIGKIAAQYRQQGKKVLMGAGDTFRAAAIEQLVEWSRRADCDIIQKEPGSDPSAVMYETVQKGIDEDYDVVICDTAGRLHTKKNLMEELKKMVRVIRKLIPDAPHEILLVLDATTGQNAIFQTREFMEATDLTGLIITKLDGTSKGGVVIGIVNEFDIPVRYIGVGEQVEDLRPFDAQQFTESIFA